MGLGVCIVQAITEGQIMKRSEYVSHLIRLMPPSTIAWSAKHPNSYMSKTHVLLHYVALRQLGDTTFLPHLIKNKG